MATQLWADPYVGPRCVELTQIMTLIWGGLTALMWEFLLCIADPEVGSSGLTLGADDPLG